MATKRLQGMQVAISVTNGFEQAELEGPRKALDDAEATTLVIAPESRTAQGMNHNDKGDEFTVGEVLADANAEQFDAVLLPGGVVNADTLRMNPAAHRFVPSMQAESKPIAMICHAPWLLVSSGLMKGRHITSYYTLQDDIRNAGGKWSDQETVVDQNWVSSRKPDDIPAFNKAMVQLFAQSQEKARKAGA
jgi:protease I